MQVRLRDLDVVAEHAVEADLERVDAGARALALLHLGDHLAARSADRLQLVERRVDAVAREAAIARERAWLVDERPLDQIADVGEVVEFRKQAAEQRRLHLVEHQRGGAGLTPSDIRRATRSRGPAVPSATRPTSRSMS